MTGLIAKVIICPIAVLLSDLLFASVYYANAYQAILTGILLAAFAHLMEVMLLKRGTLWISDAADFIAALGLIYLSQFIFAGASITLFGAFITAAIITVTEHFLHRYLIQSGKAVKTGRT